MDLSCIDDRDHHWIRQHFNFFPLLSIMYLNGCSWWSEFGKLAGKSRRGSRVPKVPVDLWRSCSPLLSTVSVFFPFLNEVSIERGYFCVQKKNNVGDKRPRVALHKFNMAPHLWLPKIAMSCIPEWHLQANQHSPNAFWTWGLDHHARKYRIRV
jgi:hypothetical protein